VSKAPQMARVGKLVVRPRLPAGERLYPLGESGHIGMRPDGATERLVP
jgi:hypothetical protein